MKKILIILLFTSSIFGGVLLGKYSTYENNYPFTEKYSEYSKTFYENNDLKSETYNYFGILKTIFYDENQEETGFEITSNGKTIIKVFSKEDAKCLYLRLGDTITGIEIKKYITDKNITTLQKEKLPTHSLGSVLGITIPIDIEKMKWKVIKKEYTNNMYMKEKNIEILTKKENEKYEKLQAKKQKKVILKKDEIEQIKLSVIDKIEKRILSFSNKFYMCEEDYKTFFFINKSRSFKLLFVDERLRDYKINGFETNKINSAFSEKLKTEYFKKNKTFK